jgi:hypothetical protein
MSEPDDEPLSPFPQKPAIQARPATPLKASTRIATEFAWKLPPFNKR